VNVQDHTTSLKQLIYLPSSVQIIIIVTVHVQLGTNEIIAFSKEFHPIFTCSKNFNSKS
jgi:hypothetical protein